MTLFSYEIFKGFPNLNPTWHLFFVSLDLIRFIIQFTYSINQKNLFLSRDHPLKQLKAAIDTIALFINAVKIEFGRPILTFNRSFQNGC